MSDEVHSHGVEGIETREEIKQLAEISASKSQARTNHNEVLLDIRDEALLKDLGRLQEELFPTESQENRIEIKRIPEIMIKRIPEIMPRYANFAEYFEPRKWTIGPIHHNKFSNDEKKRKLAALFISESGSTREVILKNFKSRMTDIRTCFDEVMIFKFKDEELMRFLFVDGCAMLGFIHGYVNQRLNVVGISDAQAAEMARDLLLLENQIPFQVLEVLIRSGKEKLKNSFLIFIPLICRSTFPRHSPEDLYEYLDKYCFSLERNEQNQKAVHLLDVFREALLFNPPLSDPFGYMLTLIRGTFWILCSCGCVAIYYFLDRFKQESHSTIRGTKEFFHSVQELKAARIKFKPSHSLKTISFRCRFYFRPQLMLPTLIVDDSTASKLLNLVAYEMCLSESDHRNKKHWVTSYVNLLDSLVDNEQDIKNLRAADILRNTLSTDLRAAVLINELGTGCVAPTEDAYIGVKNNIVKHYRTTCSIWMAQFCSTHFSNPWTITALFAATAVLVLTAIQTWYAVNPKK